MLSLLKEGLESQGKSYDTLDWLVFGQHFAKNQEEELAFQAYYMAHLLDYERIGTNSQLKFETNALGAGPIAQMNLPKNSEEKLIMPQVEAGSGPFMQANMPGK